MQSKRKESSSQPQSKVIRTPWVKDSENANVYSVLAIKGVVKKMVFKVLVFSDLFALIKRFLANGNTFCRWVSM